MGDLVPFNPGGLSPKPPRTAWKAINQVKAENRVRSAKLEAEAEYQEELVIAMTQLANTTLSAISSLSQREQLLSQTVPFASSRLEYAGNQFAVILSDVLATAARKVGKL